MMIPESSRLSYLGYVLALVLVAVGWTAPAFAAQTTQARHAQATSTTTTASQTTHTRKKKTRKATQASAAQAPRATAPARATNGQLLGLKATPDPLALTSSVALAIDQESNEVLYSKNPQAVLPIASITKLMTALVVTDASLPLDQELTITEEDVDTERSSHSRLRVGTRLSRLEMLHLALMSSENRAAHALGRNHPGGLAAFVAAMNERARSLGMTDTHYVDPTGLSSNNQSSARDLALLMKTAYQRDLIRSLTTSPLHYVDVGSRKLLFRNSNRLVYSPEWSIGLQKTGYIAEAGRCVVMQAELAGRKVILVLLDAAGPYARISDAERLRHYITGDKKPATFVMPRI